jgi:hypothetical protein
MFSSEVIPSSPVDHGYSGSSASTDGERQTQGFSNGLLIPDVMLPAQYYGRLRPGFATGEGRLLLAVLQDAIDCYIVNMQRRSSNAQIEFREVRNWFSARNQRDLFAFETICEVFGFDPGSIRHALWTLRDQSQSAVDLPTDRVAGRGTRAGTRNVRREPRDNLKRRGWRHGYF